MAPPLPQRKVGDRPFWFQDKWYRVKIITIQPGNDRVTYEVSLSAVRANITSHEIEGETQKIGWVPLNDHKVVTCLESELYDAPY